MFLEYAAVVRRHCGKFIAGPLVSALGLVAAFIAWKVGADPTVVKWIAWISVAIFPISIFPAQYGAWKEERQARLKAEKERADGLAERDRRIHDLQDSRAAKEKVEYLKTHITFEAKMGEALSGSAPSPEATDEEIKEWRVKVEEWKKRVALFLPSQVSHSAFNKWGELLDLHFEVTPPIHPRLYGDVMALNRHIKNMYEIVERAETYIPLLQPTTSLGLYRDFQRRLREV